MAHWDRAVPGGPARPCPDSYSNGFQRRHIIMSDESRSCVFCRIAGGELPAQIVHETDELIAFADLNPQAPTHILVIPRRHIRAVDALDPGDAEIAGKLLIAAARVAERVGMGETGYRVVANVGEDGGQTVPHLHLHLLGGRPMSWPPG